MLPSYPCPFPTFCSELGGLDFHSRLSRDSQPHLGREPDVRICPTDRAPEGSPNIKQTCFPKDTNLPSPSLWPSSSANQGDVMGNNSNALYHCVRCSKRPSENWGGGCGEKWLKEPGGRDDSDGLAEDGYIGGAGSSKLVFEWSSNCFEEGQAKRSSSQHASAPALGVDGQVGGHARWSSHPVRGGAAHGFDRLARLHLKKGCSPSWEPQATGVTPQPGTALAWQRGAKGTRPPSHTGRSR